MAGQVWLRFALLGLAPLLTLLLSPSTLLLASTCGSSLLAVGVDALRQRRRCLPFPIYLLLVYALQTYSLITLPRDLGDPGVPVVPAHGGVEQEVPAHGGVEQEVAVGPVAPRQPIRTMSVVMAAHNEHSYMNRTLDSIYNHTPPSVLKEIIVVDDASEPPLADGLKGYPQVRILRHEERRGLIKSKTEGGNLASSDMIMFLDAHVKPEPDWWKPLLKHMNVNYRRVVVPVIPILNGDTWQPDLDAVGIKMMFDWTLFFQWFDDQNDLVPCMSGGLFGITRQWWHESGEYDYGMMMWGGENIEQSIRVWLCGGEVYVARDSLVSHVFRSGFPYEVNDTEMYINKVRAVEAWFDEYKENFYRADPVAKQFKRFVGDLSERLALKKRLKCKPFRWYVEKFKAVFRDKHMLPEDIFLLRDKKTGRCLQLSTDEIGVSEAECRPGQLTQQWTEQRDGHGFRSQAAERCFDANAGVEEKEGAKVLLFTCSYPNEMQDFKLQGGQLRWEGYCVRGSQSGELVLTKCSNFLASTGDFEKHASRSVIRFGSM